MQPSGSRSRILWHYFFVTYVVALINSADFLRVVDYDGPLTVLFTATAYLSYTLLYLLPAIVLVLVLNRFISWKIFDGVFKKVPALRSWIVYSAAVVLFTFVQLFIYADAFIFKIYGFHLDGFVWNLVFTRGGIESLGSGEATQRSVELIVLSLLAFQAAILASILMLKQWREVLHALFSKRRVAAFAVVVLVLATGNEVTYGLCSLRGYTPVLTAATAFPLYIPLTFSKLGKKLGLAVSRDESVRMHVKLRRLEYPLKPIIRRPDHKKYNIVWLVSESLRADMLDKDIMPATWAFAKKSTWFKDHYSGGNGTRMGLFSMFYGLYGPYWFPFLDERRGPILIDLLLEDHYQMKMFTSARFSYPEFDKTLFARIPSSQLHEAKSHPGWKGDRENVSLLLNFIDKRDTSRPFMTFMFFESPHAPYNFPPENAIRKPYLENMDYATMNLKRDIGLIKNRYINACNHLDSQISRILSYLKEHKLLDSTIVLITGDHGEEFLEKGHWGHNSYFAEEEIRPPLVIWVPGRPAAEVTHMTSHLDIPATILPLLGVTNPPEDYSFGYNLFGPTSREFTVVSSWNKVCYIDHNYKAVFPMHVSNIMQQLVTTRDDAEVKDKKAFYANNKTRLLTLFTALSKFSK